MTGDWRREGGGGGGSDKGGGLVRIHQAERLRGRWITATSFGCPAWTPTTPCVGLCISVGGVL